MNPSLPLICPLIILIQFGSQGKCLALDLAPRKINPENPTMQIYGEMSGWLNGPGRKLYRIYCVL